MTMLQLRIAELVARHGSLRAAARVLQVDPAYLCRLSAGEKHNPNDALLRKMGLRRIVTYERLSECPAGSPQTDRGASIAARAQQDRYPLLYALIQSGADVCAAIEAMLTERT